MTTSAVEIKIIIRDYFSTLYKYNKEYRWGGIFVRNHRIKKLYKSIFVRLFQIIILLKC